jgi:formamidopyrimidine-DNA glycosylase
LGKRVVLRLDDGLRLVFEPRMTGLVLLDQPPTQEHLRIGIRLVGANGEPFELKFWDRRGLGQVALYSAEEFHRRFDHQRIGPDALAVSARVLRERLAKSSSPIKVALLDQRKIAGVGNLYASEILHRAGIDPRTRCREMSSNQWTRVHYQLRRVLRAAIRHEGSTLADGTYRNALNEAAGYQNHHRVYDRAGDRCSTCRRGVVVRIVQAQRATFFCPRCQA